MLNLIRIRDGVARVEDDDWTVVEDIAAMNAARSAASRPVLPLAAVLAQPEVLDGLPAFGLLLAADDDPHGAAPWLARAALIAVAFPNFADGRGYSTAVLLRTRLGWTGDLRAVGDVLRDQLFYLRRVGFTSFALRADRSAHDALAAFADFSDSYQGSVEPALPAFRRHATGAAA